MMKDLRILITAAGSPTWPQMAQDLKNNGERNITIIGVDINVDPTMLQYIDKVYYAPAVSAPNYINTLLDICAKERIDIFVPGMSQELEIVLDRIKDFEGQNVKVAISKGEGLLIANNKIKLFKYLQNNGFEVPRFYIASSIEEVIEACSLIGYPKKSVCIKIGNSAGSRGVRIIEANQSRFDIFINEKPSSSKVTLEEFISILEEANEIPELMVMEFLPGHEYCLDILADDGEVKYIVGQEVLRLNASTPIKAVVQKREEIYKLGSQIVKSLSLSGNIGFDFKHDSNGKLWITEINPRITQSLSVVTASGADLLYYRIKQLLGEEIPSTISIKYGTTIVRRYCEMFYVE